MSCSSAKPAGTPGKSAEELARKMQASVQIQAWETTGAVKWVFRGQNRHLWDRRRGYSEVVWDNKRATFAINQKVGLAYKDGVLLKEEEAKKSLDEAHAKWTNDAFWLNPVAKAFDPGTVRKLVEEKDGKTGLLVEYVSGGRTPGDAYLWWLDDSGRPASWQMWTSNVPVGGLSASWEGWVELGSGALVSTKHTLSLLTLELSEVAGETELSKLVSGEDRFKALKDCLEAGSCVSF